MRDTTRATVWTCDSSAPSGGCESDITRTDLFQDVPPPGWRVVHVLREHVNLALEGDVAHRLVLCPACYAESGVSPRVPVSASVEAVTSPEVLAYGPSHPDHPEHVHEDCCK